MRLPPLRERREDLGLLIASLLRRHAGGAAEEVRFEAEVSWALLRHSWPLNVRELEKCLSAALILAAGGPIAAAHLQEAVRAVLETKPSPAPARELDAEETRLRDELVALLREHNGNLTAVARARGKARMQIQRWMKRYGIDPRQYRR